MRKPILAAVALTMLSSAAVAEESERELAREMLELTNVEEMVTETIAAYSEQLAMQNPQMQAPQVEEMLDEAMGWEKIREEVTDMAIEIYDEQELSEINAFYRSEVGQAYAEKAPEFSGQLSQLIVTNIQQALGAGQQQRAPGGGQQQQPPGGGQQQQRGPAPGP